MIAVLLSLALAAGSPSFKADFPGATVVESPAGGRYVQASGFTASGLGTSPARAARAFLEKYRAEFGIAAREQLVLKRGADPGMPGPVRFERRIDGAPVFDADVVLGVDAGGSVILVNATDSPARIRGRPALSRTAAIRAAKAGVPGLRRPGQVTAVRGWRPTLDAIRPVWRIDFTATEPAGDWRSYVDAETGKVLLRFDRRSSGSARPSVPSPPTMRPPIAPLDPGPRTAPTK